MIRAEEHIMFEGRDWQVLKAWLNEKYENKVGMLITSTNHDQSNEIRGALKMIKEILQLEHAAKLAAKRG